MTKDLPAISNDYFVAEKYRSSSAKNPDLEGGVHVLPVDETAKGLLESDEAGGESDDVIVAAMMGQDPGRITMYSFKTEDIDEYSTGEVIGQDEINVDDLREVHHIKTPGVLKKNGLGQYAD